MCVSMSISVMYSIVALFLFLLIPWAYFFYEEGDEDVTFRTVSSHHFIFHFRGSIKSKLLFVGAISIPHVGETQYDQL